MCLFCNFNYNRLFSKPSSPIVRKPYSSKKRARSFATLIGSVSLEAAISMTIFLFLAVSLISLFSIYSGYQRLSYESDSLLREYARQAYGIERLTKGEEIKEDSKEETWQESIKKYAKEELDQELFMTLLLERLPEDFLKKAQVSKEGSGVSCELSKSDHELTMNLSYQAYLRGFEEFGFTFPFSIQKKVHLYNGCSIKESTETCQMVYITEHGSVYHTNKNCTYLSRDIFPVPITGIKNLSYGDGKPYEPCEKCKNKSGDGKNVYITSYGSKYHRDLNCNELTRTILEVPIDQVGGRCLCSKCQKEWEEND